MAVELSQGQEENVLALLCFSEKHAAKVMQQVPVELFSTRPFRDLALAAVKHIAKYGKPPGMHLKDILERKIAKSGDDGELLETIIDNMMAMRDSMQMEFMQEQIDDFVRVRELTMRITKAQEMLNKGALDEAEELVQQPLSKRNDPDGIWLQDTPEFLDFLREEEQDIFSSGITELDNRGIRPERGTSTILIAPMKKGKSWFLTNVGKTNMVIGHKILHISLENSRKIVTKRYFQSLFGYASRKTEELEIPRFVRDKDTRELSEITFDFVMPPMIGEAARAEMTRKAMRLKRRPKMHVKTWASGTLTMAMLRAYLDYLRREFKYEPDMILLDYIDIMKTDPKNKRESLGILGVELRGLAQERNLALVTVTQGTRGSMGAQLVSSDMVAEDISKVATADTVLTYSQTPAERRRGLARIFVANARDADDQYIVLITQSYATGQFALDSIYFSNDVQTIVNPLIGHNSKKRKDDDDDA